MSAKEVSYMDFEFYDLRQDKDGNPIIVLKDNITSKNMSLSLEEFDNSGLILTRD
jgi:hypothetical protein